MEGSKRTVRKEVQFMLTERQKAFADEYLIDLNATQAAIRAGYSKKTAYSQGQRALKNVEINNYIQSRLAEKEKERIASQDEVLEYLTNVIRGTSKASVVVVEAFGDVTKAREMDKAPDEKERLKAAELLGKRYGLYADKLKVDGAIPVVISGDDSLAD
jgi:phage terminase small subunit